MSGQGKSPIPGHRDLAGQQMNHVGLGIDPCPTGVLVESHGPETDDLAVRVGVEFGEFFQLLDRDPGEFRDILEAVGFEVFAESFKVDDLASACLLPVFCRFFQGMACTQPVADVGRSVLENRVLVDEIPVDFVVVHQVFCDCIPDCQVGLRLEDQFVISQVRTTVRPGGKVDHFDMICSQTTVGDTRPEHGVTFRHVCPPEHDSIGEFDIIVASRGFVDAEGFHERRHRRGHAMSGVGIDIV